MAPTPVHRWHLPHLPSLFSVWVKRDDLTGCSTSGNKLRKAEFILADAIEKGSDCIVTFGGIHSNHARTMALAAREVGLDSTLFIMTESPKVHPIDQVGYRGNMMLCRLSGATVVACPREEGKPHIEDVLRISALMEGHLDKMRLRGRKPYFIPVGGTCPLGEWGYIHAWEELRGQRALDNIDDVIVTIGSGGTACALAVANYLTGSRVKVHAVTIINTPADDLYNVIGQCMEKLGVRGVEPRDLIDLIDGRLGDHGFVNEELKELVISVASETGVILDSIYTGKAVLGMLSEMRVNPHRFRGNRILFINTGGMFNAFNGILDDVINITPSSARIHGYSES
jgi:D-cysteine desulfhydrase family pyridoxal phosphate-dependent enzyme